MATNFIKEKRSNFLKALATYSGTIIGVGIFGLPFVAMSAGFIVVLIYFIVLTVLAISVNNLYGEMACDTHKMARVPGYVEEYLGPKTKKFSFVVSTCVLVGALLAYLILGGEFLYLLMKDLFGGPLLLYVLLFFIFGAIFIYRGIKSISQFELVMLIIFFIILFFFLSQALPFIKIENLLTFDSKFITFPYGVILFSLGGLAMVPEAKEMVHRNRRELKKVITWGIIMAAIACLIFVFSFLGATGKETSKNAISGFAHLVGPHVILVGCVFGLITTFTSFITLGLTLKKMFVYDFRFSDKAAYLVTCLAPLLLYLAGVKNFIDVIGLTGALLLGIESSLIIFCYRNFLKKRFQRQAPFKIYIILLALITGVIFQFVYFFVR